MTSFVGCIAMHRRLTPQFQSQQSRCILMRPAKLNQERHLNFIIVTMITVCLQTLKLKSAQLKCNHG